jgi:hypothetical protein
MKTYGATRTETLSCSWGCCGGALRRDNRGTGSSKAAARRARKRARQQARRNTRLERPDCEQRALIGLA